MIKKIFPFILMLSAAGFASAQEVRLMAGFNTIQVGETGADVTLAGGTGFQFEADAQFGQRIYVQPGIGYVIRNAVLTMAVPNLVDPLSPLLAESDYSTQAFRLSLMGGYRFMDEFDREAFNIRGFFGPSLLIGTNSRFENAQVDLSENNTQFFLTIGAGLERDIFFVDAGYDFALTEAFDVTGAEGRFNMLRVNLGVRLRFLGREVDTPLLTP